MTNRIPPVRILLILLLAFLPGLYGLLAQETGFTISGKVLESGSGIPLKQAVVSVSSTGEFTDTDQEGYFSLILPTGYEKLVVSYPGYFTAEVFTLGKEDITVYLSGQDYRSDDEIYSSAFGTGKVRNATNALSMVSRSGFDHTASSSFDQDLEGRVAGLHVVEQSGMPGHRTWMNLRGISSIFARNEPLVIVDGMIHEISYPNNYRIEGHSLNPMDIVDVDDIVDVTVIKTGEGHMGSAGSNGIIYVNTEQKKETSAMILLKMYGGISLAPSSQEVMGPNSFRSYFNSLLLGEGYTQQQINIMYPWLFGGAWANEYYRYNNSTDWQKELFRPSALQKYYIFLKGGDDIATYNISSGYLRHGAPYENWRYSRYNLRLNGKVNITNHLAVIPNTKLSLSDTYLTNMGPTVEHNPVTSSLLKSPLMSPNERDQTDGTILFPYDDVGAFNISNPAVLVDKALGSDRNFQLVSSVKIQYTFNPRWVLSHLIGTSVNNDRVNIFIPDIGVVQLDSAWNSPQDMVTEFRSSQNHTTLTYRNTFSEKHNLVVFGGLRYIYNSYKNNQGIDLNTPSDDFRSLGEGSGYDYLRANGGELREIKWVSYFTDLNYSYRDKYYLRASASYDASSVFNSKNRYNFYPSVFAAWRLSSEEFLNSSSWLNDLKLRAAYSITGNMFSSVYDYSSVTYTGRRYNNIGVVVRDYNPNEDLAAEKKSTIDGGLDLSFNRKATNLHIDYYYSMINNLVINQLLPYNYGFVDYFDNGGALTLSGIEFAADARFYIGRSVLVLDATVTHQTSKVKKFDFLNPDTRFLTKEVYGAEYIASEGNPVNAFYGYRTDGIYTSDAEANGIIGPNGRVMGAGDVVYLENPGSTDNVINRDDKQIIGDPNPDLFGSLSASLTVGRFGFSTLFTYSIGNDIFNYVRYKITAMDGYGNQSTAVEERWQAGMTDADLPGAALGDPNGNSVFSDRWIEDGSYLRLKQLTMSYTTSNIFNLQKEATFYLTGANLLTLTKYSGYDPETLYMNDPYFLGIDYGKIPICRSVIFGIQLSL